MCVNNNKKVDTYKSSIYLPFYGTITNKNPSGIEIQMKVEVCKLFRYRKT